jgi:putative PEP-CTERM system TPR-repeat lipoprotein
MKMHLVWTLLIAFTCVACSGSKSDAEYIATAQSYIDKGDTVAAIIELKNALGSNPQSGDARRLLGEVYLEIGDWRAAEKELTTARELGISNALVLPPLARALLGAGRFDEVLSLYTSGEEELTELQRADLTTSQGMAYLGLSDNRRASLTFDAVLASHPDYIYARYGLARVSFNEGDLEAAREKADGILAIDAQHGPTWRMIGLLEQSRRNSEQAIEAFSRAIEYSTVNVPDYFYRALAFIDIGELDQAEQDVASIRSQGGNTFELHYARGLLRFQRRDYDGAQEDFELITGSQTPYPQALFYAGAADMGLGRLELAESKFRKYLSDVPENPSANRLLGQLLYNKREYAAAEEFVRASMEVESENIQALSLLALVLLSQDERAQEGIEILLKLEELQPDSFEAKINLADALESLGDSAAALEWLDKALQLSPDDIDAVGRQVRIYLNAGNGDKALETARGFVSRNGDNPTSHSMLGGVYLSLENRDSAVESFESALRIDPGNVTAHAGQASVAILAGDFELARNQYQAALKAHPGNVATLLNLATLERNTGNPKEAIEALQEAVSAHPNELEPRLLLAEYLLAADRYREVSEAIGDMPERYPDNSRLLVVQAQTAFLLERYTEAELYLSQLESVTGGDSWTFFEMAKNFAAMGDDERQLDALKRAAGQEPAHPQAQLLLARYHVARGQYEQAHQLIDALIARRLQSESLYRLIGRLAELEEDYQRAVTAFGGAFRLQSNNFNLLHLSNAYWETGKTTMATHILKEWLKEEPSDGAVLLELAGRQMTLGEDTQAVESYRKVLAINSSDSIALNNLAVLLKDTDNSAALSYARTALEKLPDNPTLMDTTASVLLASKDKNNLDEARKLLDQAIAADSRNLNFQYHRALLDYESGNTSAAKETLAVLLASGDEFSERPAAVELAEKLN